MTNIIGSLKNPKEYVFVNKMLFIIRALYYSKRQIHFLSFIDKTIHKSLDYVRCFFRILQRACDVERAFGTGRKHVTGQLRRRTLDCQFQGRILRPDGTKGIHLSTVVKQDLSVSVNFDHVVKFCIQDHVDGSCKGFCEMNLHSQDRFQPNRYSPTSKTMATSEVIWNSTPVPEKWIKFT
jgi:hypothetical protein